MTVTPPTYTLYEVLADPDVIPTLRSANLWSVLDECREIAERILREQSTRIRREKRRS